MALPVVAIIGRPNVGKSSLLNALAGEMISIVEPTAGVTRDRISTFIKREDKYFELIDTGGYGIVDSDELSNHIERQIFHAIGSADLVIFMVDIRDGLVPLDITIAQLLRKHDLEVIGVANKADSAKMFPAAAEFNKLGFGEFLCISATENLNKAVLLDMIFEKLESVDTDKPQESIMKIAVVGKRNAGKSSIVNAMAGSERVIVSEIPGTTRDSVDVRLEKDGQIITVIDTAGVRKIGKMENSIEFYSYVRVKRTIGRADVVLFMIDATVPISQVDKKLAKLIEEEYKTCILVINKWDLAKDTSLTEDYQEYLTKLLPGLKFAPIAFTTATESKNIQSVLDLAAELYKQATTQIPTPKLNKAFDIIKEERGGNIRAKKGKPKFYYTAQIATNPITLLMFVNKPELFEDNFRKMIVSRLRSLLPIDEVPIRLIARAHRRS
ncbi:MAG: ribosome biogenesis GTPase Der [Sedimentisphaerales bacterium]|nr:ribosome biogenesis GTPase Der [Sedimentisphaerales bacterium]